MVEETNEVKIYKIRGKEVMLDSDLAKLYGCVNGTKTINQAVSRNIERFPERFRFQLEENEFENLKSQLGTAKHGGIRKRPYVFTEQGVAMLATVLRTELAAQISIRIMDAFVNMRKRLRESGDDTYKVNDIETRMIHIENKFDNLDSKVEFLLDNFKGKDKYLFFNGEYYDSYSVLIDILKSSKEEIIIVDNYVDKSILDILSKTKVKVIIITNKYNNEDVNKYLKQYNNLKVVESNIFHDRFIIIDKKELYHSGASFKDFGKKGFAISKIDDQEWIRSIMQRVDNTNNK